MEVLFKQEKQTEKKGSPLHPFSKKEKIKEKNNYNNSKMDFEIKQKKGRKSAFIPPTLDEVQAYMDEIGEHRFTALRFWNYYEAKGWVLGKARMRFWKLVLDNCRERENNRRARQLKSQKMQQNTVIFREFKPVDRTGAVSYEEYLRMKNEADSPK